MKLVLKYTILAFFILNMPGFINSKFGLGISSLMSYASFLLLVVYYFFYLKGKPNIWLIYVGLSYFLISGLNAYQEVFLSKYIILILKYLILVVFGNSFFKAISRNEMTLFLLIGAITVIINATVFPDIYGRYAGFYLNPNAAGFICIIGYALSFKLSRKKLKLISQLIFTIAGLLTFSRTFILVWIMVNLISLRINIKNIRILGIGFLLGILLLTFGELFNLNGLRFKQYQDVFSNKSSVSSLEKGGRSETWAIFYDEIFKRPFFGGGFGKFQGNETIRVGPHNTYLLIILEAGIFPLLIFLILMFYLLIWSNKLFALDPTLLLLSIILIIYLLTNHNYFDSYIMLCITLYIHQKIEQHRQIQVEILKPEFNNVNVQ